MILVHSEIACERCHTRTPMTLGWPDLKAHPQIQAITKGWWVSLPTSEALCSSCYQERQESAKDYTVTPSWLTPLSSFSQIADVEQKG